MSEASICAAVRIRDRLTASPGAAGPIRAGPIRTRMPPSAGTLERPRVRA